MENKSEKRSDGSDADWPKVGEGNTLPNDPNQSIHKDGSIGIEGSMAGMDGSQDKAIQKKDQELLIKAGKFRDACIKNFIGKASAKYDKGQLEHGGYLPSDVSFVDIEDEVIDIWFYVQAMKVKIQCIAPTAGDVLFHDRCKDAGSIINGCGQDTETTEQMIREDLEVLDNRAKRIVKERAELLVKLAKTREGLQS
jgi:hypothetical protein